jgi:hypothetical protein
MIRISKATSRPGYDKISCTSQRENPVETTY